ncbi:MAG: molecular chaperone HtpG, partial [Proteobacteria bacterium]|nr:molecular chaperone HtpG [Pseudomonadota bacterium]
LYSHKEVFLRELISNSSDACDKLRFEALSDESLYEGDGELAIHVEYDDRARAITVRDNGIGMSREEIIENLGTIARSGTRQFFEALTGDQAKDSELIGQFGVGFYASFMVADQITVTTRRAGLARDEGVRWESRGEGDFTVESVEAPKRGTRVVLHLRDGEDENEFLDSGRLRSVVHRYSDHISFPVKMLKQGEDETGEETVNTATALWTRTKAEISDEEYSEFYKHIADDFDDPLVHLHSRVEGNLEYTSLLYIPKHAPFDLWDRNVRRGVNLYVRRVFIMDDAEQLMPPYLRFVRGVIDSADLPLHVSREILQKNRQIDAMRAGSVKKILDLLAKLAKDDTEKFAIFWREFGKVFKEGLIDDPKNKDSIADLLRFASTQTDASEHTVSLADYVDRLKEGQELIYYITADSHATAVSSPHLEIFRKKGMEVLLLSDEIDEWMVNHLQEYKGRQLRSVTKGELDAALASGDKEPEADQGRDHDELLKSFEAALGQRVKAVRVTNRLTTSPACLVADDNELGGHLERLLKAAGQDVPNAQPIMEINPEHVLVTRFAGEADEQRREDWANILFDQALLSEGGRLPDPAGFVRRLNEMFLAVAGEAATRPAAGKRASPGRKKASKAAKSGAGGARTAKRGSAKKKAPSGS